MNTILYCIDTKGPGGAETVFMELATRLTADKYRSIAAIRGKGWVYEELLRRCMQPFLLVSKGSFNWRYLRKLARLIREERVDLLQSHLLGSNVYCSLAGMLTGRPVFATFHGTVDIGQQERLKNLKFRAINRGAASIVAVSRSLRSDITSRTPLLESLTRVIYNGIDTGFFERPRSRGARLFWLDQFFAWSAASAISGQPKAMKFCCVLPACSGMLSALGAHRYRRPGRSWAPV